MAADILIHTPPRPRPNPSYTDKQDARCERELCRACGPASCERQRRQPNGPKRKVLQYLKGRKRRLERFLCGRISPAPLNSPDFATLGPFWPRHGAPCRNTAVMPVFAPQAAVSQPPGRWRRRRRPQTRRQGCGRPTPLPARLSTRASTAGRFPPAPGRAHRCSGARARATCHE